MPDAGGSWFLIKKLGLARAMGCAMLGEKVSQVALRFGADDLDGTVIEEKITHAAGALTGERLTRDEMAHIIRRAGRTPVERDAFYNPVMTADE